MTYVIDRMVTYRSTEWVLLPGVFEPRPNFADDPLVTERNIDMYSGKRVLDIGCGCGVRAIIAAAAGAHAVTATDIMPNALVCTKINAERLGYEIDIRYSNLFSNVNGKFDAIVAYLPSFDAPIVSYEDIVCHDPGLVLHRRLMSEAQQYLTTKGILHITIYGEYVNFFESMIEQYGYTIVEYKVFTHKDESWHFYDLSR